MIVHVCSFVLFMAISNVTFAIICPFFTVYIDNLKGYIVKSESDIYSESDSANRLNVKSNCKTQAM